MTNESRNTGLLRLAHLREVSEAKAGEMEIERERFGALAEKRTRAVSAFNLFQTPEPLAREAAERLGARGRILEPSAGLGRLYRAVRMISDSPITLIEIAPELCGELYRETELDGAAEILQRDFLDCSPAELGTFDGILMNPPFKFGRDIKHIEHALKFLSPGGRLVSFCFAGSRQRKRFGNRLEILPAGSFRSEGTRAEVAVITFDN